MKLKGSVLLFNLPIFLIIGILVYINFSTLIITFLKNNYIGILILVLIILFIITLILNLVELGTPEYDWFFQNNIIHTLNSVDKINFSDLKKLFLIIYNSIKSSNIISIILLPLSIVFYISLIYFIIRIISYFFKRFKTYLDERYSVNI